MKMDRILSVILVLFVGIISAESMEKSSLFGKKVNYDRSFSRKAPTDLDTLLRGKEIEFSDLKLSQNKKSPLGGLLGKPTTNQDKSTSKEHYVLQFEAVADFDAAQKRKFTLQQRTGYGVWFVFDAPFYKLRGGGWSKKEDAEDQAVILRDAGISAFVIKVR